MLNGITAGTSSVEGNQNIKTHQFIKIHFTKYKPIQHLYGVRATDKAVKLVFGILFHAPIFSLKKRRRKAQRVGAVIILLQGKNFLELQQ